MTNFGGDVNMEGFESRKQIVIWVALSIISILGMLFFLRGIWTKDLASILVGFLFMLPLPKKIFEVAERKGYCKILQRLTPLAGMVFVIMILVGIGGMVMFCAGFETAAWEVKMSRFSLGVTVTIFSVSYIYHTWRQIKKEGEVDQTVFIHRLPDGKVDRIDKITPEGTELRFRLSPKGKPVLIARVGASVQKHNLAAAIRQVAAIFQKEFSRSPSIAH